MTTIRLCFFILHSKDDDNFPVLLGIKGIYNFESLLSGFKLHEIFSAEKNHRQVGAPFDLPRASVRAKLGVLSGLGGSDDMVDA